MAPAKILVEHLSRKGRSLKMAEDVGTRSAQKHQVPLERLSAATGS